MAVGNAGSPLCAELNRLANGGTYPLLTDFLDEMGAANKWAGTTGLGGLVVGVLKFRGYGDCIVLPLLVKWNQSSHG